LSGETKESAMPKFGVKVPHQLTRDEARSRLERFVEMLEQKFGDQVKDLQQSWDGDTLNFKFRTYGIQLDGGIAVADNELNLSGDLPFPAMMFRGKIESAIREQLEKLVA
jgi:putative polyhydroxyalkanoate system protein